MFNKVQVTARVSYASCVWTMATRWRNAWSNHYDAARLNCVFARIKSAFSRIKSAFARLESAFACINVLRCNISALARPVMLGRVRVRVILVVVRVII